MKLKLTHTRGTARDPPQGHRDAVHRANMKILSTEGTYLCRQCGTPLYTSTSQIPLRLRLAELRPGDPRGSDPHARRGRPAYRDHLRGLRWAPGARL